MMAISSKYTRRRFVQLAAAGTGSICLLTRCSGDLSSWRFFTADEANLVDAIAEQIIPSDEWPGGKESGVTNYIDKQLVGPHKRFQSIYQRGLSAVRESCAALHNKKFEELSWDDQTAFLECMEAGKMEGSAWADGFDRKFFELLRDHCMQSYYGSPIHGGNRNKISYKMIGLDYPLIVGQNRYKT
jgi:gluconate 2-dehydrogenase gamma chain